MNLINNSIRAFREHLAAWQFYQREIPLYQDINLVSLVKEFWLRNMSSASMLRCLTHHNYHLSTTQLRNLRLHPTLRLLMGTASTDDARLEATRKAELYVRENLMSGQAVQYGRIYALSNIRLSGVFISQ